MVYMLMQQEVADFPLWREVFDANEAARRAAGVVSTRVFQEAERPNAVTLLVEWPEIEQARRWLDSPVLRAAMRQAGVLTTPRVTFLNES